MQSPLQQTRIGIEIKLNRPSHMVAIEGFTIVYSVSVSRSMENVNKCIRWIEPNAWIVKCLNRISNLNRAMSNAKPCIFCDIVNGLSPDTCIEYSNDHIVIFKDIRPASDYHYLAVPKNHMQNVRSLTINDKDLSKLCVRNCDFIGRHRIKFCSFTFK